MAEDLVNALNTLLYSEFNPAMKRDRDRTTSFITYFYL